MTRDLAAYAATADVLAHRCADIGLLTSAERDRVATLRRHTDRDDYVAAHLLVRALAAHATQQPVPDIRFVQRCPACNGCDHGRPALSGGDAQLSLSHSRGAVAAAAARSTVGIDIERPTALRIEGSLLTATERAAVASDTDPETAFARLWVRKEVLMKAGRAGLDELGLTDVLADAHLGPDPAEVRRSALRDLAMIEWSDELADGPLVGAAGVARDELDLLSWDELAASWR